MQIIAEIKKKASGVPVVIQYRKGVSMADVKLSEIMNNLHSLDEYKMHFAKCSEGEEPLDVFIGDFEKWKDWNRWSNGKNDFNRKYIFSLINFYPEVDTWLFGGIWEITNTDFSNYNKDTNPYPYTIELCPDYRNLIGRLKIKYSHRDRMVRNRMEEYFPHLLLKEILPEPYSIQTFPGYRNLDVPFRTLENAILQDCIAWKNALQVKGIYLITDMSNGKKYVGKASGEHGFWQRWSDYIYSGHGGDVELRELLERNGGISYARTNFKFTLLEIVESCLGEELDDRETYWKNALTTRMARVGLNRN